MGNTTTYENIHFTGQDNDCAETIEILDMALQENGNFGQHGDFRDGLEEITQWYEVEITTVEDVLEVNMGPIGGGGDEFNFVIEKDTCNIIDLVVGEVVPEDDDDLAPASTRRFRRARDN